MSNVLLVVAILVGCAILVLLIRRRIGRKPEVQEYKEELDRQAQEFNKTVEEHNEDLKKVEKEIEEASNEEVTEEFHDLFGPDNDNVG